MELTKQEQSAITQLMSDLSVSQATAQFIYKQGQIPKDVFDFPEEIPFEDLVNIKIRTLNVPQERADFLVRLDLGILPRNIDVATQVWV